MDKTLTHPLSVLSVPLSLIFYRSVYFSLSLPLSFTCSPLFSISFSLFLSPLFLSLSLPNHLSICLSPLSLFSLDLFLSLSFPLLNSRLFLSLSLNLSLSLFPISLFLSPPPLVFPTRSQLTVLVRHDHCHWTQLLIL